MHSSLRLTFAALLCIASVTAAAQTAPPDQTAAITAMMQKSVADWNRGDLDAFATCYKNSPDILFIGHKISRGYDQMLTTYKTAYNTPAKMGTLNFTHLEVQALDAKFATLTGNFHLERTPDGGDNADGYFLLVVENTPTGWKIVRDDSTSIPLPSPAAAPVTASAGMPPTIAPCPPEAHQFDFWLGEWSVTGPKGKHAGDSSIQSILGNCVILENWTSAGLPYTGKSFNSFDVTTKSWTQYWVDSTGASSLFTHGIFTAPSLIFEGHNPNAKGEPSLQRFTFTRLDADNVRQLQEDSTDGGKTWTTTYDLHYTRKPAAH